MIFCDIVMLLLFVQAPKEKNVEEVVTLEPKVADGEEYFAVAHIFASFNDTFVVSGYVSA